MAGRNGDSTWLLVATAATCMACSDPNAPPGETGEPTCSSRGRLPSASEATWTSARSPYRLRGEVVVPALTIEAGTLVCAEAGSRLVTGTLQVNGTADAPVQFLPATPGVRWGGIRHTYVQDAQSHIRHARIVDSERALDCELAGIGQVCRVLMEDVHILRVSGPAISGAGTWRRVAIDSACSRLASDTIPPGRGCVSVFVASRSHMEDVTIRDAGGDGIALGLRVVLFIGGGAIENNRGSGIITPFEEVRGGTVIFEDIVRITGNTEYPLMVPFASLRGPLSTEAGAAALRGNGRDTILAFPFSTWGSGEIQASGPIRLRLPVRTQYPCISGGFSAIMVPGSRLEFVGSCPVLQPRIGLSMAGTADAPITVTGSGTLLGLAGSDTLRLRHVHLRNLVLGSVTAPVLLEDARLDSASLYLTAGARVTRSTVRHGGWRQGPEANAAVTLGADARMSSVVVDSSSADGVRVVGANVSLADCVVRGSAGDGISVQSGSARIQGCDLERNAGSGVHNATAQTVDARDNWWGDALGPLGPDGDGVSGAVQYVPFRVAPSFAAVAAARQPARVR